MKQMLGTPVEHCETSDPSKKRKRTNMNKKQTWMNKNKQTWTKNKHEWKVNEWKTNMKK